MKVRKGWDERRSEGSEGRKGRKDRRKREREEGMTAEERKWTEGRIAMMVFHFFTIML